MEPKYVRAKVTGEAPIRDVLTRESVEPGGEVVLLVRDPGTLYRCPRHPKRGVKDPTARCLCAGTQIESLVESGAIGEVRSFDPDARPVKAEKP